MNSRTFLARYLDNEFRDYFGPSKVPGGLKNTLIERWSNDTLFSEKHRFNLLNQINSKVRGSQLKILDMAAGCGSFVIQGLINGYETYGIEPEEWKHNLIDLKFEENKYSRTWRERIAKATGEKLPFGDDDFDIIDSWQTFEHVADIDACVKEFYRVLKPAGFAIIRAPSYISFYEGHYRIFWLPMMGNNLLSRIYLKLRGRPLSGLDTFSPINKKMLVRTARKNGFKVRNLIFEEFEISISRKYPILRRLVTPPIDGILFFLYSLYNSIRYFGKVEPTIHLLLEKKNN